MTTLTLQVTEVRFDFDDLDFTPEEQQAVLDDVLGNVFEVEVDDGYDDEVVADALGLPVDVNEDHCFLSGPYALLVHNTQPAGSEWGKYARANAKVKKQLRGQLVTV